MHGLARQHQDRSVKIAFPAPSHGHQYPDDQDRERNNCHFNLRVLTTRSFMLLIHGHNQHAEGEAV
jgi:hypothetical protein